MMQEGPKSILKKQGAPNARKTVRFSPYQEVCEFNQFDFSNKLGPTKEERNPHIEIPTPSLQDQLMSGAGDILTFLWGSVSPTLDIYLKYQQLCDESSNSNQRYAFAPSGRFLV